MKIKFLFFIFFVLLLLFQQQIVQSVNPPQSEYDCLINIIDKFNLKPFDSYRDITKICSSVYVSCDTKTGNVTRFQLNNLTYRNNAQANSTDFSCLPNLENLMIWYQNITNELIYYKFPKVKILSFAQNEIIGGGALDQPFQAYSQLTISNVKGLDINTPFKLSYINNVGTYSMYGLYAPLEVDSLAFKNITFFRLSGSNYPDLSGFTKRIVYAEFQFDDTFKLESISNFTKYSNMESIYITHGTNNKIPFYFTQNKNINSISLPGGSRYTTPYETPTSIVDLSLTGYNNFLMSQNSNFNLNGDFPFIIPPTCTTFSFNGNNITSFPNNLTCTGDVQFQNNGIDSILPKFIGKANSFDLQSNQLTGTVDQSWCSTELVVTNNKLLGRVPSCFSCYFTSPSSSTSGTVLMSMYYRFLGNKFVNLNNTAVSCPTFAPQVKWLSTNSVSITGIDIGFDPSIWLFNGAVRAIPSSFYSTTPGQYPQLVLSSATLTGPTFTINFQYPINYVFTFPTVVKSPHITLVKNDAYGRVFTFNGTYFSSYMRHLNQEIRIGIWGCDVMSTDFYSITCTMGAHTVSVDSSLKLVNFTAGYKKTAVYIRTDGLVSNDHLCPNDCSDNQGVCDLSTGTCTCEPGYSGADCSFKNCAVPDCNGFGTCNGTTGLCQCDSTHLGDYCQYSTSFCPIFNSKVCNGYTCNTNNNTCTCSATKGGVDCSIGLRCVNGCWGNGVCNNGTCHCFEGYGASDCSVKIILPPVGSNGRYCTTGFYDTTGVCPCYPGYGGPACDQPFIQCPVANNSIVCNRLDINWCDTTIGKCQCDPSFQSDDCSIPFAQCPSINGKLCNGIGSCNNQTGICSCDSSHQGADCSLPFIQCPLNAGKICSGFGTCNNQTGVCTCNSGRLNNDCSVLQCDDPTCNNNGVCDTFLGICQCDSSHQGSDCILPFIKCPSINSNDCNGFGSCNNQTGICSCDSSHQGSDCSKSFIECPNLCSGFGSCNNETGICSCNSDRLNNDCSGIQCSVPNCNGRGTCDTTIGKCQCLKNTWSGSDCSIPYQVITSVNESTTAGGEATFEGIFGDIHQGITMQIGGIDCPIIYNSSTIIKCMAPAGNGIKKVTLFQNDIYYTYDKYKYKTIELSCPSNCLGNGICNTTTAECKCNSGYGSFDCTPIINGGGDESNSNGGEQINPPKSNTTINDDTGGTTIINQEINFQIYFKSLYEIDYSGQIVKTYQLENNWVINNDSNNNGQYTFTQTIDNGCIITSRIEEVNNENGKEFYFAGTSFTVSNGGIKFTITIDNYQYQSNLNTLTVDFESSVEDIQDTQQDNNNQCNSKDTEIDTSNVNDLSNFNYIKISKNNKILSGRFINRMLSNGKATFFSTSVRNESNSIIVSLNLPYCSECIIDPDFSVLISSDFVSNCPSVVDKRKSYIVPVSVVASVVGVAAIGTAGFFIHKKMNERKFLKSFNNKMKNLQN